MPYKVSLAPSGASFISEENILNDALNNAIQLEHSCKKGDCGSCSATVLSGLVENESGEKVTEGNVLTCSSKPLSDITLEAIFYPELSDIKLQTLACKVSDFSFPLEDIMVLSLRLPANALFNYLPGQYIDLSFQGVKRSYSIANAKQTSKNIELHLYRLPGGQMSEPLFTGIKNDLLMRLEGPKGTFFVRAGNDKLIFIASGTGFAPIKAMIESLIHAGDQRNIHFYWAMAQSNYFYSELPHQWSQDHSYINYTQVVVPGTSEACRVKALSDAILKEHPNLDKYEVYACGANDMIKGLRQRLISDSLQEAHFYSDAFLAST